MDQQTVATYDTAAARIAALHRALMPSRTLDLVAQFFHPGGATADVGCGSGRDTAWLAAAGFPVTGYDASEGMLAQARAVYPELTFVQATLPELRGVPDGEYANVFCNAVLMHLPAASLGPALQRLGQLLRPGGRLLAIFRPSTAAGEREPDGRLFTAIALNDFAALAGDAGLVVVHRESRVDDERPAVTWYTVVAERQ